MKKSTRRKLARAARREPRKRDGEFKRKRRLPPRKKNGEFRKRRRG